MQVGYHALTRDRFFYNLPPPPPSLPSPIQLNNVDSNIGRAYAPFLSILFMVMTRQYNSPIECLKVSSFKCTSNTLGDMKHSTTLVLWLE